MYIYIYIYIYKERERERFLSICVFVDFYMLHPFIELIMHCFFSLFIHLLIQSCYFWPSGTGWPGWSRDCKNPNILRNRDLIYGGLDARKLLMKPVWAVDLKKSLPRTKKYQI